MARFLIMTTNYSLVQLTHKLQDFKTVSVATRYHLKRTNSMHLRFQLPYFSS